MTYLKALRHESGWYLRKTEGKLVWLKLTIIYDNWEFTSDLDINNFRGVIENEVRQESVQK